MSEKTITLKYDGPLNIATARSRKTIFWDNKEIYYSALLQKLDLKNETDETAAQYLKMGKADQDDIKDVGGFVGGELNRGRRKKGFVVSRSVLTLDIDFSDGHIWENVQALLDDCAAAMYSTHKHSPTNPRLRLIMPLSRPVNTDEYDALCRRVAGMLGIDFFDDTTFEPERLMYWQSSSKGAEYIFKYQDEPWMNVDAILSTYKGWNDYRERAYSSRKEATIRKDILKQGDPLTKAAPIGTFCREYSIHDAIEKFLPQIYSQCDVTDRYTYIAGSTGAGLVIYDDKYAYSHHGTDPTSGKLCNAFDLVRIHMFGIQDEDAKEGTPGNSLPSFQSMLEFIRGLDEVKKRIGVERLEDANYDFADGYQVEDVKDQDWLMNMDADKKGNYLNTTKNIRCVLDNDINLKGKLSRNKFENRDIATSDLPWRTITPQTTYLTDTDDAGLRDYLETQYNITGALKLQDAVLLTLNKNSFHPVREYLSALSWDGEQRIDSLLIDYLGASDSDYVRAVTRKTLVAAVARVFSPGCKFDFVLVLNGKQGIGKSTLIKLLGHTWYSDTLPTVQGKEAFEQLQGVWIIEMAELAGLKKAEMEQTKHFISKSADIYRVAYGKRTENFPRQCIFIGTTNTKDFLRDPTGNRRFWPIDTLVIKPSKSVFSDLTETEIGQIWAEAVTLYKAKEPLYLSKELEEQAKRIQTEHSEVDDRTGIIQKYLDTLLPADWSTMDITQRRAFLQGDELQTEGTIEKEKVCIAEIWCELFNKSKADMTQANTKDLHNIMRSLTNWDEAKSGAIKSDWYGKQRHYCRIKSGNTEGNTGNTRQHSVAKSAK